VGVGVGVENWESPGGDSGQLGVGEELTTEVQLPNE
jgi:hypothetical protein